MPMCHDPQHHGRKAKLDRLQPSAFSAPDQDERTAEDGERQPRADERRRLPCRLGPDREEDHAERGDEAAGRAQRCFSPAEESESAGKEDIQPPGEQVETGQPDQETHLQDRDCASRQFSERHPREVADEHRYHRAECEQIKADRRPIRLSARIAQQHEDAPDETHNQRGSTQPPLAHPISRDGQPGCQCRKVEGEQRHVRPIARDEERRGETAG